MYYSLAIFLTSRKFKRSRSSSFLHVVCDAEENSHEWKFLFRSSDIKKYSHCQAFDSFVFNSCCTTEREKKIIFFLFFFFSIFYYYYSYLNLTTFRRCRRSPFFLNFSFFLRLFFWCSFSSRFFYSTIIINSKRNSPPGKWKQARVQGYTSRDDNDVNYGNELLGAEGCTAVKLKYDDARYVPRVERTPRASGSRP